MRNLKNKDIPEDNEQQTEQTQNIDVLLAISDENVYSFVQEELLKIKVINIIGRVNSKEELLAEIKDKSLDIILISTDLKGEENLMYLTPKIPAEIRIIAIDTVNVNRLIYGKMQEDGVEFLDLESIKNLEALIFSSDSDEEDEEKQEDKKQTDKKKKKAKEMEYSEDSNDTKNIKNSTSQVKRGKKDISFTKQIMNASTVFLNRTSRDDAKINPKAVKGNDEVNRASYLPEAEERTKTVKDRILGSLSIGIGGAGNSAGTTHTALSIASYLKKLGQKVAVIEFNNKPKLRNLISQGINKSGDFFTIYEIDVYYQKSNLQKYDEFQNTLIKAKSENYKYIILDLGVLKKTNDKNVMQPTLSYNEMWRTDCQILCLNGAIWGFNDIQFYRCDEFAEVEPNISDWSIAVNLAADSFFNEIKKEIKNTTVIKTILQAPIFLNPFNLEEQDAMYIESLIKDVIPNQLLKRKNSNNRFKILKI